jgi:hypothetical protein
MEEKVVKTKKAFESGPPKRTRSRMLKELHYTQEARLYCQGKSYREIGAELGLSAAQVLIDLKAVHERWVAHATMDMTKAKARELAKIDELERTYWDAWERSQREKVKTDIRSVKTRKGADGMLVPVKITKATSRSQRDGFAQYLEGVAWCIDRRIKLLGLDAPVKVDVEARVRQMAMDLGIDPDEAIREAEKIFEEAAKNPMELSSEPPGVPSTMVPGPLDAHSPDKEI